MRQPRFIPFLILLTLASTAVAASAPEIRLVIEHQSFHPATLTIPAGERVKVMIENKDDIPAEFESYDFNREKVIAGHSASAIYVGPLEAGSYDFFNDFHKASKGRLVVE